MRKLVLAFGLSMSGMCVQAQELYPKLTIQGFMPEFSKSTRNDLFHDSTTITVSKGQHLFLRPTVLRKSTVKIEIQTSEGKIDGTQELKKFNDTYIYEPKTEGKLTIHFSSDNKKTDCRMYIVPFASKLPDGFDKLSLSAKLISIGRMAEIDFIPVRKMPVVGIYNPGNREVLASDINPLNDIPAKVTIDSETAFTYAVYQVVANPSNGNSVSIIASEIEKELIATIKKEEGVKTVNTGLAGNLEISSDLYAPYDSGSIYGNTSGFGHYLIKVRTRARFAPLIQFDIYKVDTISSETLVKK